jgi:rSAM/selenodomain-associated transferase 1
MSYCILDPGLTHPAFTAKCALTVMAKAPRPGAVKTRLSPPLTLMQSAALNICFLRDTAQNIADVATSGRAAGVISYTPAGDEALFDGLLPDGFVLLPQRGEGFGARLLASAEDVLACGFSAVCLIDSDSPTLPAEVLREAVEALGRPGDRVVLGGSNDGGYYLIGLKAAHPEPFANIAWSTANAYKDTVAAIGKANLELVELPLWYDVDDAETLGILRQELLEGVSPSFARGPGYDAMNSRRFLSDFFRVSE